MIVCVYLCVYVFVKRERMGQLCASALTAVNRGACCSVLQCVVVCCSVLQCVPLCSLRKGQGYMCVCVCVCVYVCVCMCAKGERMRETYTSVL